MRKLLIITLMLITLGFIVGCSGDVATQNTQTAPASPASPSAEPPVPTDKSTNIEEIVDIDEYSYIGIGQANSTATSKSLSSSSKVVMLGMKNDGKVEVVHFKDAKGQISKDPHITANMSSGIFDFYKISFDSSTYYGTDFASAAGNIYCVCTTNGKIYKLDDVTSIDTGFGTYDYYDGVFVGSLTFNGNDKRLCKVYLFGSELNVDKKLSILDFPEFGHVFLDRNINIFAYTAESLTQSMPSAFNYAFNVRYVLSSDDIVVPIPQIFFMLGYNRVVYSAYGTTEYHEPGIGDNSNVKTISEELENWFLVESGPRAGTMICPDPYTNTVTALSNGKYRVSSEYYGGDNICVKLYENLDFAKTEGFIPPELSYEHWVNCMHGPYLNWCYSELIDVIDGVYYYATLNTRHNDPYVYIVAITYTNEEKTEYTAFFGNKRDDGIYAGGYISPDYIYANGKLFYINGSSMKIADLANFTNTAMVNAQIIRFHSIDKVNGNEVAFEGTNTSAQRVYYKINTDTLEIENLGTVPSFESVSFSPIKRI